MTPLRVPIASDGNGLASAAPPSSLSSLALVLPDVGCSMAIAVITRSPRIGSVDSGHADQFVGLNSSLQRQCGGSGQGRQINHMREHQAAGDVTSPYVARVEVSKIVVI